MKNRISLIGVIALTALIVFTMAACKSASEKADEQNQKDLQGTWRCTETIFYEYKGESVTYTVTLTFKDSNFTWINSDGSESEQIKGTYTVSGSTLTLKDSDGYSITFQFSINNNKLTLTDPDGYKMVFTKV